MKGKARIVVVDQKPFDPTLEKSEQLFRSDERMKRDAWWLEQIEKERKRWTVRRQASGASFDVHLALDRLRASVKGE